MARTSNGSEPVVRVLVITVVHHPEDARIRHRQLPALLDAGFEVTYVAPRGDITTPPAHLHRIEIPRADGRHRLAALRAAREVLAEESPKVDLTIVHDPELTLLDRWITGPKLWDVHEDLPAQLADKTWIPSTLRGTTRTAAKLLNRRAQHRFECIIAEPGYAKSFLDASVVRNAVNVPTDVASSGPGRAVYLGRVSRGRGAEVLAEVSEQLPESISLEVFGPVEQDAASLHRSAAHIHGFVPNDTALEKVEGATVGLSLLEDLPNYRHSMPTKILEYLARGVPVVTTPLPEARQIIEAHNCGIVVPFGDADAVTNAIISLNDDEGERRRLAENGRRAVQKYFNWTDDAAIFVDVCQKIAAGQTQRT